MFNVTLKYFSISNNKPPTSWVAHITKDILTCYSCSYYRSMLKGKFIEIMSSWNLSVSYMIRKLLSRGISRLLCITSVKESVFGQVFFKYKLIVSQYFKWKMAEIAGFGLLLLIPETLHLTLLSLSQSSIN